MPDARLDRRHRGRFTDRLRGRLGSRFGRQLGSRFRAAPAAFLFCRLVFATGKRLVACFACYRCDPDIMGVVVHRTILNNRFQRTAVGQRQNIQTCSPSAMEKKIIWARPTMFSIGTYPTADSTRLSVELSRLSPIMKKWPGGTV